MLNTFKFFCLFMTISVAVFAQNLPKNPENKGKIDDSSLKTKNDKIFADLMFMGRFYMGRLFDDDSRKDYSQALKYFKKANIINSDSARMEIYKIYLGGGYGEDQNLAEADKYYGLACAKTQPSKQFEYHRDVNLCNIADLQKKALAGDEDAMVVLALHLFELDFSQHLGNYWLDKAKSKPDAAFLKERYALSKKRYLEQIPVNVFQQNLMIIADNHAKKGSEMAKMVLVSLKSLSAVVPEANALLANFLKPEFSQGTEINLQDELRFKALLLLAKATTGKEKVIAIMQVFEAVSKKIGFRSYASAHAIFLEAEKNNTQLTSITGLDGVAERYKISDLNLNINEFNSAYGGEYLRLVELYKNLSKPENASWIGQKNLEHYKKEINSKINTIIGKQQYLYDVIVSFVDIHEADAKKLLLSGTDMDMYHKTLHEKILSSLNRTNSMDELVIDYQEITELPELKEFLIESRVVEYKNIIHNKAQKLIEESKSLEEVLRLKKAFESDSEKKLIFPEYEGVFAKKIASLGVADIDVFIATQKIDLAETNFAKLPDLKILVDNLNKNPVLSDPAKKKSLLSFVKKKGILDLYGADAPPANQAKFKADVTANKWLEPEASEMAITIALGKQKDEIFSTPITSFEQGKKLFDKINTISTLPKNVKDSLLGLIKEETIRDIYGKDPSKDNVKDLDSKLKEMPWLLPEGKNMYWFYEAHYTEIEIQQRSFESFEEAKTLYDKYNDPSRPKKARESILGKIRAKVVREVYDKNPSRANLDDIKSKVYGGDWLRPEGMNVYLDLYNNSDGYFIQILANHDSTEMYRYEVTQSQAVPQEYELKISTIEKNNYGNQNVVYSSIIKVKAPNTESNMDNSYLVQINYRRRNAERPAMWDKYNGNYFQGAYAKNETYLQCSSAGGKFGEVPLNQKHGLPQQYLIQKEDAGAFTAKAAIKTSLKYFIFVYKAALSN